MEIGNIKQVRFAKILEAGGKPEAYLAFSDPDKDPSFMRAAKESRVVTIKQEPTSKRKDFGIVGYVKEKYATYLIFPKSLQEFSGQRVIGIDYSILQSADVRVGGKVPARRKKPEPKKQKTRSAAMARADSPAMNRSKISRTVAACFSSITRQPSTKRYPKARPPVSLCWRAQPSSPRRVRRPISCR